MLTANKGEWSELYVFLKLLADGKLYAADANLDRIPGVFYPIISILRHDSVGDREYRRNSLVRVIDSRTGVMIATVPVNDFLSASELLLENMQRATGSSFSAPKIEEFVSALDVKSIKAKSSDKRDITIIVHDLFTGMKPELGFSIKSNIGSRSTLLNPGSTTNFIYEIIGTMLSPEEIEIVNSIETSSKVRERIRKVREYGGDLKFVGMENATFALNLQLIDTLLPEIIAQMLLHYYLGEGSSIAELLRILTKINPFQFDLSQNHPLYEYKIKSLLTDIALGMTPAKAWKGNYDATGGYIIVKADGELVCYHIYNRSEFQDYLINNTHLDTPSTSRFRFAAVHTNNGKQFFKLNLQIRFH